ncbi:hypothetical protein BGZ97_011308 [Linnemannia gamsii]|uniref:Uncharacterized protein n=1 Tax=Linnemannia gamsii TaxID=64522 RepID=A0A9P6R8X1_9FUNG|nr:hypothetical protein BGZ97_011308 [Linnemannia gamsii]
MPLNGNNDRRSSISGRSMDEMEVVIASSSRNAQGALSSSSVHPFHQPHNANRYENGGCDNDDDNDAEDENDSIEKATSSATASKTKSSLGQGYDISTMFQVGPLPTPLTPMA